MDAPQWELAHYGNGSLAGPAWGRWDPWSGGPPAAAVEGGRGGAGCQDPAPLLFFDWDDTIMPTTWLMEQGILGNDDWAVAQPSRLQSRWLAQAASAAAATLVAAKQIGTVIVVTNADRGWIEVSCHAFMPSLFPVLEGLRLTSAKSSYAVGPPCGGAASAWKLLAFRSEARRVLGAGVAFNTSCAKQILSIGDGTYERVALHKMAAELPNCRRVSVKFADRPCVGELCGQHALLAQQLRSLAADARSLDLRLACGLDPPPPSPFSPPKRARLGGA